MSELSLLPSTGQALGEYVGTLLYADYGYKAPYIFTSTSLLVNIVMCVVILPEFPTIALKPGKVCPFSTLVYTKISEKCTTHS